LVLIVRHGFRPSNSIGEFDLDAQLDREPAATRSCPAIGQEGGGLA
jgi:hypothetical protein